MKYLFIAGLSIMIIMFTITASIHITNKELSFGIFFSILAIINLFNLATYVMRNK